MGHDPLTLYGGVYVASRPWPEVWDEGQQEFEARMAAERRLGHDVPRCLDAQHRDDLTERLYRSEQHGPTRPHPFVPHRGVPGRVARTVARRVDRFWDAAEGRMIPEPVRHHDRSHDGLLAQYLLADPHLDPDEDEGS